MERNRVFVETESFCLDSIDKEEKSLSAYRERICSEIDKIQKKINDGGFSEEVYVEYDSHYNVKLWVSLYRKETDAEFKERAARLKKTEDEELARKSDLEQYAKYLELKDKFQEFLRFMEKTK